MFLDLLGEFGEIELGALLRGEGGAVIEIVEEMLIRIRAGRSVLGKCLKNVEVALRGLILFKATLDHGQFVVAGGGIATDFDVAAEEFGGFGEFLVGAAEVRKLEQGIRKIGIGFERPLKIFLSLGLITLAAGDVSEIEKTGGVAGIELR